MGKVDTKKFRKTVENVKSGKIFYFFIDFLKPVEVLTIFQKIFGQVLSNSGEIFLTSCELYFLLQKLLERPKSTFFEHKV